MLFEVLGDVSDEVIIANLVIGLELTKVDQFRQRSIWLVFTHLVYLSLQLHSVAVVVA